MTGPIFDDEFGLCIDPCEHPSINGGECAVCGAHTCEELCMGECIGACGVLGDGP